MPLLTIRLPQGATLDDAVRELGLAASEVDTAYGLIPLDPDQGLCAVRVTDAAAQRMSESESGATIFADPRIEPANRSPSDPESPM